jgi:hypothetical protein
VKVILVGHRKSKAILPSSSWLIKKYLPSDMDVLYLNSGRKCPKLYVGRYIDTGWLTNVSPRFWSLRLRRILVGIEDEFIILGLDDFFLSRNLKIQSYEKLMRAMAMDANVVCAHLSISPERKYFGKEFEFSEVPGVFELVKNTPYLISTQYSIWRKDYLVELLSNVRTPWEFEVQGSKILSKQENLKVIHTFPATLAYPESSAMSARTPGYISVLGNKTSDILELIERGHLDPSKLVLGQWKGTKKKFTEYKDDLKGALIECPEDELVYYTEMLNQSLEE